MDELDSQDQNEYLVTASQIFDFCGVENTAQLSVEALMDKFLPSEKSNKSEYIYLKHILDPMESNPQIDVATLANALHLYSETKKVKVNLDDSINLKSSGAPHDSDSGISNDDYQLVEELRCEIKDKRQIASQLREQMYFMEQHNEAEVLKLITERDALKAQLLILKEDKIRLSAMNNEIEETSSRLLSAENTLQASRRDLELCTKQIKQLEHEVNTLMFDKQVLQEQLLKSKDECHRMNDLYASRQVNLLEQNETLKTEHADISNKYEDQKILLEQIVQEKLLLEMELRDIFDKSNQSPRMDHTIDVSYTEDQMLSTLDSLNADSRFGQQLLDEEAFVKEMKDCVQGRSTNMTLFDEIRNSFCNSLLDFADSPIKSCQETKPEVACIGTQTEEIKIFRNTVNNNNDTCLKCEELKFINASNDKTVVEFKSNTTQTLVYTIDVGTEPINNIKNYCKECEKLKFIVKNLEKSNQILKLSKTLNVNNKFIKNTNNDSVNPVNDDQKQCTECKRLILEKEHIQLELENMIKKVKEFEKKLLKDEDKIKLLRQLTASGKSHNKQLQTTIADLKSKVSDVELKMQKQQLYLTVNSHHASLRAETQKKCVNASVATQADQPCTVCEENAARNSKPRRLTRFVLNATKSLFQIFAVLCFGMALVYLYNVFHLHYTGRCSSPVVPWRWFSMQDLLDFAIKIEYTGEIPM